MRTETDKLLLRTFGNRVRCLRTSVGLSQEGLAELAHLDRTYISSLERGHRNVSLLNCARIAAALRVPLRDLVPPDDSPIDDYTMDPS